MENVSTTQKVKNMLNSNPSLDTDTIMRKTGARRNLIYQVRWLMKKNLKQKTKAAPKQETKANQVQVGGYHYRNKTIQPWDAIHAWGLGFFSGNVVKYVARHREKNGVQDLKKARHYLDKLIELMDGK